jgi:hypothetical protein
MGIKRNDAAKPEWNDMDYAVSNQEDIFSLTRWKREVNWDIILMQVEKTRQASQMIDISLYPSTVFFAAIDLLEANLYMVDDMFYYLTGLRMTETHPRSEEASKALGFWNMDSYKELERIGEELMQTRTILLECLKYEPIWDITLQVKEKYFWAQHLLEDSPMPKPYSPKGHVYSYARAHYETDDIDQEARSTQIATILELLDKYWIFFHIIYRIPIRFPKLLAMFRQSQLAQTDFIEPWRHDFGGTRDSLISRMERDPELGPWVNRYIHCRADKDIIEHLFLDERDMIKNKEEVFNTDNWIRLLTIAAVLQEYDEHQKAPDSSEEKEEEKGEDILLLKLSLYFKDEETVRRFLKSVRQMNNTEITTLVSNYHKAGLCTDVSKNLWKVLHDAGLYKPGYTNWNAQVK